MKDKAIYLLIMFLIGMIGGIAIGMIAQQTIIKQSLIEIGYSFSGAIKNMDVEVNLNESKLIEGAKERFREALEERKTCFICPNNTKQNKKINT